MRLAEWLFPLLGFVGVVIIFVVVPYTMALGTLFRRPHPVRCPETGTAERVTLGVLRQTVYSVMPVCDPLRLRSCTRWPARRDCDQACTRQL